jgi:hypothetical protein
MDSTKLTQISTLTVLLSIGLAAIIGLSFRTHVAAHWDESRCDATVIPIAGLFKPPGDPRTAAAFAADNWKFCQKEYVQAAIRTASAGVQELADAEAATVEAAKQMVGVTGDIFYDLWNFCHDVYTKFMGQMKTAGTLFRNFMIRLYSIIERLQGSALAIVYSLISLLVGIINSIHVTIIAAVIVVGIMLALQIILFFLIWPISSLLMTVAAMVDVVVISMAAAIAGGMANGEFFSNGSCFETGSLIRMADGSLKPIERIQMGERLWGNNNRVTAIHQFITTEGVYSFDSVSVTGDHLIYDEKGGLQFVSELPVAVRGLIKEVGVPKTVWCFTTSKRVIPSAHLRFADWEEIQEDDTQTQKAWYKDVCTALNGVRQMSACVGVDVEDVEEEDAGLASDCKVIMGNGHLLSIQEVRIGDELIGGNRVTGVVCIEGDLKTDALRISNSVMTAGTWVFAEYNEMFQPAHTVAGSQCVEMHPIRWYHLYTTSGIVVLEGYLTVRDANEVSPDILKMLVKKHIVGSK